MRCPVGRSTAADVQRALDALERGARPWGERSPDERAALLERGARRFSSEPDPDGALAARLALQPAELAQLLARRPPPRVAAPRARAGGLSLVRPHWGALLSGAQAALAELAAGRAVLLLADPRVPELVERLADVLLEVGVEPGALAQLTEHGRNGLLEAAASGRVARFVLGVAGEDGRDLVAAVERAAERAGFGAGVVDLQPPEVELVRVERGVARVALEDDPERRAREVARAAFGRLETLSGQLDGQVGVVHVHARRLSRFTEALLRALEHEGLADPPAAFVDPSLSRHLEEFRDLGLDEGATLIHEGGPSQGPRGGARLTRLVFTNLEPQMQLVACSRPAPALLLMRGTAAPHTMSPHTMSDGLPGRGSD